MQKNIDLENLDIKTHPKTTCSRRVWVVITWFFTWWIPTPCISMCGMKQKHKQIAWREKVAIFIIILISCAALLFFIIGVGKLMCPKQKVLTLGEIAHFNTIEKPYVAIYGRYYDISEVVKSHISREIVQKFEIQNILGSDVSQMFFPAHNWDKSCPGITNPGSAWDNLLERTPRTFWPHYASASDGTENNYIGFLERYARGRVGWTRNAILATSDNTKKVLAIFDNVYDVTTYYAANEKFFDDNMNKIFSNFAGKDATEAMNSLMSQDPIYYRSVINCMNHVFYIGTIDHRNDFKCQLSNWIMLGSSGIIVLIIGVKFLAALVAIFKNKSNPEPQDKYVLIQVPCYTEDTVSLENTFNSIAETDYDQTRKLMIVICDGIVTGQSNGKPTPDLALEILYGGADNVPPKPAKFSYYAVAQGSKGHNLAQVYSGLYNHKGQDLPFIVIVKTGTDDEHIKAGNRGKRDSQVILMRFLNKVYSPSSEMTPLEIELYRHINDIIGCNPKTYEYLLMVDADTIIMPNSLTVLVSKMTDDRTIVGLCGITEVGNESSWVTWIQIYEYYISHFLAKAFESMFGTVTCLPGCFCMYRIRAKKDSLCLINHNIVNDYSDTNVNTLHKQNLLTLGEDRYLTTLVLKHCPRMKTVFTQDAKCLTNTPDYLGVLLSQRRRWINSTIHNLIELLNLQTLCGICCFGMRSLVIIELLSTVVMPASVAYIGYLIYSFIYDPTGVPFYSLIMLAIIYGVQAVLFILRREFSMIGWMIIYILGMPVFNLFIPLYAFWKMDDLSWGQTRSLQGDDGKKIELVDDTPFDPKTIPTEKISEWRQRTPSPPPMQAHYQIPRYTPPPNAQQQIQQPYWAPGAFYGSNAIPYPVQYTMSHHPSESHVAPYAAYHPMSFNGSQYAQSEIAETCLSKSYTKSETGYETRKSRKHKSRKTRVKESKLEPINLELPKIDVDDTESALGDILTDYM